MRSRQNTVLFEDTSPNRNQKLIINGGSSFERLATKLTRGLSVKDIHGKGIRRGAILDTSISRRKTAIFNPNKPFDMLSSTSTEAN